MIFFIFIRFSTVFDENEPCAMPTTFTPCLPMR